MHKANIIEGQKYWTTAQSLESDIYEDAPVEPWKGIAKLKLYRNGDKDETLLYLHRFNHETDKIDDDTYATAIPYENTFPHEVENIFQTKKEAAEYYIKRMARHIESTQRQIVDWYGDMHRVAFLAGIKP